MARGISLVNMALGDFREVTAELPDSFLIPVSKVWIETHLKGECDFTFVNRDRVNDLFQVRPANELEKRIDIKTNRYNTAPPPAQCKDREIPLDD